MTVYIVQCFVRSTSRGKSTFFSKLFIFCTGTLVEQFGFSIIMLQSCSLAQTIILLIEARFIARTLAAMTSATATRIVCRQADKGARRRKSEYPGLGTPASSRSLNSSSCECGRSKTFFVLSSLSLSLFATSPALLFLFSLLSLAPSVYDVYYSLSYRLHELCPFSAVWQLGFIVRTTKSSCETIN